MEIESIKNLFLDAEIENSALSTISSIMIDNNYKYPLSPRRGEGFSSTPICFAIDCRFNIYYLRFVRKKKVLHDLKCSLHIKI